MNKIIALLLGALLISSVSCQFLNAFRFNNDQGENNGYDYGEDHGEDYGEDHGEDYGEDQDEISGDWNNTVHYDNGESVDQGEFYGHVKEYDNGEFRMDVFFSFSRYQVQNKGGKFYERVVTNDKGEIIYTGFREQGRHGKIGREEVVPQILKRLKQY